MAVGAAVVLLASACSRQEGQRDAILDDSGHVDPIPGLHYDGLYESGLYGSSVFSEEKKRVYLRFYSNNSVIMVTVVGVNTVTNVQKWFTKEFAKINEDVAVGRVIFRTNMIDSLWFRAIRSTNPSDYSGRVEDNGVVLYDDNEDRSETTASGSYRFCPF